MTLAYLNTVLRNTEYYGRLDGVSLRDCPDYAGYTLRLRKGNLVTESVISYNEIVRDPIRLLDLYYQTAGNLCLRDMIGLDIMMLHMDADHGNGD